MRAHLKARTNNDFELASRRVLSKNGTPCKPEERKKNDKFGLKRHSVAPARSTVPMNTKVHSFICIKNTHA